MGDGLPIGDILSVVFDSMCQSIDDEDEVCTTLYDLNSGRQGRCVGGGR